MRNMEGPWGLGLGEGGGKLGQTETQAGTLLS